MADAKVEVVITAVNRANETLKTILDQVQSISKALDDATKPRNIKIDTENTKKEIREVGEELDRVDGILAKVRTAFIWFAKGTYLYSLYRAGKAFAEIAAQSELFETTLLVVGRNAGYTEGELKKAEKAVTSLGIELNSARKSLTQMARAGLDLSLAGPLTRVAQDLSVVAGWDASDTLNRLITNIERLDDRGLRWMGLIIDRQKAFSQFTKETGIAVTSANQRMVFAQAILRESTKMAGTYALAMGNAGQAVKQIPDYLKSLYQTLGQEFLPYYAIVIKEITTGLQDMGKALNAQKEAGESVFTGLDKFQSFAQTLRELAVYIFENHRGLLAFGAALYAANIILTVLVGSVFSLTRNVIALTAAFARLGAVQAVLGGLTTTLAVLGRSIGILLGTGILTGLSAVIVGAIAVALAAVIAIIAKWDMAKEFMAKNPGIKKFVDGLVGMFDWAASWIKQIFSRMWADIEWIMNRALVAPIESFMAMILRRVANIKQMIPAALGGSPEEAAQLLKEADRHEKKAASIRGTEFGSKYPQIDEEAEKKRKAAGEAIGDMFGGNKYSSVGKDNLQVLREYVVTSTAISEITKRRAESDARLSVANIQLREELQKGNRSDAEKIALYQSQIEYEKELGATYNARIDTLVRDQVEQKKAINARIKGFSDEEKAIYEREQVRQAAETKAALAEKRRAEAYTEALSKLGTSAREFESGVSERIVIGGAAIEGVLNNLTDTAELTTDNINVIVKQYESLGTSISSTADAIRYADIGNKLLEQLQSLAKDGQLTTEAQNAFGEIQSAINSAIIQGGKQGERGDRSRKEGGPAAQAEKRAAASATSAEMEAAVRRTSQIEQAASTTFLEELKDRYNRGLVTTEEYYAERLNQTQLAADREDRALEARRRAVRAQPSDTDADKIRKQTQLRDIENERELNHQKQVAANEVIFRELRDSQLKDSDELRSLQIEILKYTDAQAASQEALTQKYEERLRFSQGEKKEALETLFAMEQQDQAYKRYISNLKLVNSLQLAALATVQAQLELEKNRGEITSVEYQQAGNAVLEERIRLSKQQLEQEAQTLNYMLSVQGVDPTDERIQRQRENISRLEQQIIRLQASYKTLGDQFRQSFGNQVSSVFDSVLLKTKKFGDALRDSIRAFSADVIHVITRQWGEQAAREFSKIGSDAEGKGGPFEKLADLMFPKSGEQIIADVFSKPLDVIVTNWQESPMGLTPSELPEGTIMENPEDLVSEQQKDSVDKAVQGMGNSIVDVFVNSIEGLGKSRGIIALGLKFGLSALMGFASGGQIQGPGTGTSDSILARVSKGEFIVKEKETRAWLPLLEAINNGSLSKGLKTIPMYAEGGLVNMPSIPASTLAASSTNVAVNINADMTTSSGRPAQQGQLDRFGQAIGAMIQDEIVKQKRPGGLLYG